MIHLVTYNPQSCPVALRFLGYLFAKLFLTHCLLLIGNENDLVTKVSVVDEYCYRAASAATL